MALPLLRRCLRFPGTRRTPVLPKGQSRSGSLNNRLGPGPGPGRRLGPGASPTAQLVYVVLTPRLRAAFLASACRFWPLRMRAAPAFLASACRFRPLRPRPVADFLTEPFFAALPCVDWLKSRSAVSDTSCLTSPNARSTGLAGCLRRRPVARSVARETRARRPVVDLAIGAPLVRGNADTHSGRSYVASGL